MKNNKSGCIINNSSIAALRNNQGFYLYSAAKAAVTHLTKVADVLSWDISHPRKNVSRMIGKVL